MRQMAWAGAVQRAQPEQHEETPQHEWRNTAHLGDATQLISREIMGSLRAGAQDVPFAYEAAGVFGAIRVARSRVHCVHEVHEVRLRLRLRRLLLRRMLLPLQPLQQMRRRIVLRFSEEEWWQPQRLLPMAPHATRFAQRLCYCCSPTH